MLLIIMGFLIVVIIYINMQRECRDGEVCAKSTSTQNPGAKKPVHAGTDTSQNSKSRSAVADRLNSLRIDFFNEIAYDISVETRDRSHYTYVTQDTRSVASASVSRLFGADGSLLLIIRFQSACGYVPAGAYFCTQTPARTLEHTPAQCTIVPRNILFQESRASLHAPVFSLPVQSYARITHAPADTRNSIERVYHYDIRRYCSHGGTSHHSISF